VGFELDASQAVLCTCTRKRGNQLKRVLQGQSSNGSVFSNGLLDRLLFHSITRPKPARSHKATGSRASGSGATRDFELCFYAELGIGNVVLDFQFSTHNALSQTSDNEDGRSMATECL
jgi:hypothetical protein